jgi:hypothetical protein
MDGCRWVRSDEPSGTRRIWTLAVDGVRTDIVISDNPHAMARYRIDYGSEPFYVTRLADAKAFGVTEALVRGRAGTNESA